MERDALTKQQMIAELTRSPHGKLEEYIPAGSKAAKQEPEFLAHIIAWNQIKGQIRDSKVALPVLSLHPEREASFTSNALAHIALQSPRDLARVFAFAKTLKLKGQMRSVVGVIERYLRSREANWPKWERMAVQHRATLKTLYAQCHLKPHPMADQILFKEDYPVGSVFEVIHNLKRMSPAEAAGEIMGRRIPFLVALGALESSAKDPALVMALIERMTSTELVTNTKLLERLGVKTVPALRAAFEKALEKATTSKKATFKTTRAAEAMGEDDEALASKLRGLQEKQIKALGGVDGDWLVLGDKSGSMAAAIETARHVAATLAKLVKGQVHLVFFDTMPRYIDATGKTYDEILAVSKSVTAAGGTSIGCGVRYAVEKGFNIDGIAIVSDGCENSAPRFADAYKVYKAMSGKEPPVYFYHCLYAGSSVAATMANSELRFWAVSMAQAGIDFQTFELPANIDYYSIPNLAQTMRVSRYGLIDEIMETKLLTLDEVLPVVGERAYAK